MRGRERYLVYPDLIWLPPWMPPNHGRVLESARWFLHKLPGKDTGIFRLSDFPSRYWVIRRLKQVAAAIEPPRSTMNARNMPMYPPVAIVSNDELGALIDQGYLVDVFDGPYWSRDDAHRSLDLFWEDADPRPIRWPSDPLGIQSQEPDWDRQRFYNVDGAPAIVQGPVAMKLVHDGFAVVTPSSVRAEGIEISEAEFDRLADSAKRQGDKRHEA